MTEVIQFGKYKGQPLEVLQQDKQYTDWLMGQDWFRDRYSNVYTLIVNNFGAPAETPEHNSLQALFLDDELCVKLFNAYYNKYCNGYQENKIKKEIDELEKKKAEREKDKPTNDTYSWRIESYQEEMKNLENALLEEFLNLNAAPSIVISDKKFEERGHDLCFRGRRVKNKDYFSPFSSGHFKIELKPQVGDDYPAILRQMKANESNFLVYKKYTSAGVTEEQMKQMFFASYIFCYRLDELI